MSKYPYLKNYYPAMPALEIQLSYPENAFSSGTFVAIIDTGAGSTLIPEILLDGPANQIDILSD